MPSRSASPTDPPLGNHTGCYVTSMAALFRSLAGIWRKGQHNLHDVTCLDKPGCPSHSPKCASSNQDSQQHSHAWKERALPTTMSKHYILRQWIPTELCRLNMVCIINKHRVTSSCSWYSSCIPKLEKEAFPNCRQFSQLWQWFHKHRQKPRKICWTRTA